MISYRGNICVDSLDRRDFFSSPSVSSDGLPFTLFAMCLYGRAVRVLKSAEVILAEDTRHSARLLQHYDITTPTVSSSGFPVLGFPVRVSDVLHACEQAMLSTIATYRV